MAEKWYFLCTEYFWLLSRHGLCQLYLILHSYSKWQTIKKPLQFLFIVVPKFLILKKIGVGANVEKVV